MKKFEYYYNILYYFYFKFAVGYITTVIQYNPFFIVWKLHYRRSSVKKEWLEKGISDPYQHHKDEHIKKITIPTSPSFAIMTAHGIAASVIWFSLLGIYHVISGLLFPSFADYYENIILFDNYRGYNVIMILLVL